MKKRIDKKSTMTTLVGGSIPLIVLLLFALSACNTKEVQYVYWGEKSDNQIERLIKAKIQYEIRGKDIWINESQLKKAVACCS